MNSEILHILSRYVPVNMIKKVSSSDEWCSPCPVCQGEDRFRIWPRAEGGNLASSAGLSGKWWCRRCENNGDIIDLLIFSAGVDFKTACSELGIRLENNYTRHAPLRQLPEKKTHCPKPKDWNIPSEMWRSQATKLVLSAHESLLNYDFGLKYLSSRGIPLKAVARYKLGYLAGEDKTGTCLYRNRKIFGLPEKQNKAKNKTAKVLWIPRGIIIPCWAPDWDNQKEIHRIRIRRHGGDLNKTFGQKYILLEGSAQAPLILYPKNIPVNMAIWVVVEAELDAYALHYACGEKIGVLAVLTDRGKPDKVACDYLKHSPLILNALDFDTPKKDGSRPGYQGWEWWEKNYTQARRWPVPYGKDPGDAYKEGLDLKEWIIAALPRPLASSLFKTKAGVCRSVLLTQGERGEKKIPLNDDKSQKSLSRFPGLSVGTKLDEAILPKSLSFDVSSLRNFLAGKTVTPDLLITCPRTKPTSWWWKSYKYCQDCYGHPHCIIDFLLSPQMLAPLEGTLEEVNV